MAVAAFDAPTFEALCAILGNTGGGLIEFEIGTLLRQFQNDGVASDITEQSTAHATNRNAS